MPITRRAVLLAGLGLAVAGCAGDGPSAGTSVSGRVASTYRRGARTGWVILYPPGHDRAHLPVLNQATAQLAFAGRHLT